MRTGRTTPAGRGDRPVHPLFDDLDPELLERTEETPQPDFTRPMLATLHDEPFHREGWIYERKLHAGCGCSPSVRTEPRG